MSTYNSQGQNLNQLPPSNRADAWQVMYQDPRWIPAMQALQTHRMDTHQAEDLAKQILGEKGMGWPHDMRVGDDGRLHQDAWYDRHKAILATVAAGAVAAPFVIPAVAAAGAGGATSAAAGGALASTPIEVGALTAPAIASGAGMGAAGVAGGVGASSTAAAAPSAMHSFLSSMATPGGASLVNGGLGLVSGILSANANNKNEAANRQLQKDTTYLNSTQLNPVKQPIDIFRAAALRELANQGPTTLGGPHHDFSGVANQFLNDNNLSDSTNRFFGAQNQFAPPGTPPPPDYFKRRA